MNKIIITILTICVVFVNMSCDKMLDLYPHNAVASDNISEDDADLLLTGLYNIMQNKPTENGYISLDVVGGNYIRGGGSGYGTYSILINDLITVESGFVNDPWNGYYTGLYQVNEFIQSIKDMPDSDHKNEMLGVASFFRGLIYYNLVSRWGTVPIIEVPTTKDVPASPEAEVWSFVEQNLETAIKYCPDFSSNVYVSRQAAQALMARVKLARGKMTEAATLAESVIADGHFALADFDKIFRGITNNEVIFAFANLVEESGVNISTYFYTRESAGGGSYTYAPTNEVMNMFEPNDKREAISVGIQGTYNVLNKYPSGESGRDPIIITRLGEMYLISAEAQGRVNGLARLNELRAFRGLNAVSPATDKDFVDAILKERRCELLGEGFRWFDLVRLGRLESDLKIDKKFNRFPIPSRELELNKLLKQNEYWAPAE